MANVYIDLSKLKSVYNGLGQFCLHLSNSIQQAQYPADKLDITFLVPPQRQLETKPGFKTLTLAQADRDSAFKGLHPFGTSELRHADLWHACSQDSSYSPPNDDTLLVLTIHDLNFIREGTPRKIYRRLRELQVKVDRAAAITTISQFSASEIRAYLNLRSKPLYIVPNGCNTKANLLNGSNSPYPELSPGEFLFTIGDITPKKNFHVLLGLMENLPLEKKLVISGNAKNKYAQGIRKKITQCGWEKRVILTDVIPDHHREWLYKNCEAFLFPSLTEGFGLPVIEAMKYGKPVFVSRSTSLPEVVGDLGFYFDNYDQDHMSSVYNKGMAVFNSNLEFREKVKKHAETFSWDTAAEEYLKIYQEVLEQNYRSAALIPNQIHREEKKLDIAFALFKYFPHGGLQKSFFNVLKEAIKREHLITVYCLSWEGNIPDGVNVKILQTRGFSNHAQCSNFAVQLKEINEKKQHDIVIGFNRVPNLDIYYCADVCYQKYVEESRSLISKFTGRYQTYKSFEEEIFLPNQPTEILSISESENKNYQEVYDTESERFHLLPPGIMKQKFRKALASNRNRTREKLEIPSNATILLMVGSDFERKGVDRTIEALAALPSDLKNNTHLVVAGRGMSRSLRRLATIKQVAQRVHFLGGRDDIPELMAAADLLLHPAYYETAGSVILEAIVTGLPVLVTQSCGFSFHIEAAQAGEVIPDRPFDQENMNEILKAALRKDRSEWKENALVYTDSEDLYSRPQSAMDIIENIYFEKQNARA